MKYWKIVYYYLTKQWNILPDSSFDAYIKKGAPYTVKVGTTDWVQGVPKFLLLYLVCGSSQWH